MARDIPLGDDQVGQLPPDRLFARVSEQLGRAAIPLADDAAIVEGDERAAGDLQDRLEDVRRHGR
jgi:hypothetical protein